MGISLVMLLMGRGFNTVVLSHGDMTAVLCLSSRLGGKPSVSVTFSQIIVCFLS